MSYTYDSWGQIISIDGELKDTVGKINPYRYRGYRYDNETQLYYLQSRYYNPSWGRFINADAIGGSVGELLSHNIFAYCANNVVNLEDPSGFRPVSTTEETDAMRRLSLEVMVKSAYGDIKPSAGKVAKSVSKNIGKGTFDSTINSVLDIKLNENVSTGKVFKQVGYMERYVEQCRFGVVLKRASNLAGIFTLLNAGVSIQDNIATYGYTAEAGGRIAIDALVLGGGIIAGALLPATVGGFALGVVAGTALDIGGKYIKSKKYGDPLWN